MAFFKFRQRGQPQPQPEPAGRSRGKAAATETAQESIDSVRRRARHRLVGAAVLVLLAVIGFPLLFDTQPRPVVVDAPITIPDKDKTAPLRIPAPVPASASLDKREEVVSAAPPAAPAARASDKADAARPAGSAATAEAPKPDDAKARTKADDAQRAAREEQARQRRDEERAKAQAQARRDADDRSKREDEARARRDQDTRAKPDDAERARALLEGRGNGKDKDKTAAADGQGGRFIVQVGAFAEDTAVREARQKAERAGVRTYTQVVNTAAGPRTRVRVGPFASREEAERAAATLKKAGLAGSVLAL